MSAFTCITCRVVFVDGETQRAHYKTDWHRYNLKRKVAQLPSVTAENFRQRVLNAQETPVGDEKPSSQCSLCRKHFSSQNALENHFLSKKHKEQEAKEAERVKKEVEKRNEKNEENKENERGLPLLPDRRVLPNNNKRLQKDLVNQALKDKLGTTTRQPTQGAAGGTEEMDDDESDTESVESWDENSLGIEECLFCSFISQSLEENVSHMTSKHSFFLPDVEYISDLEGLITYLGEKVGVGHVCLWCNEKGKSFYSTKSVQQHMQDKGHCKMLHEGDVILEYTDFYDYRSSYPDYQEGEPAEREEEDMEEDVQPDVLAADGYELVLPSGATIGHRSLHKYYKQNINPRSADRTRSILPKMLAQYKALGWTGATGAAVERRVKDLGAVQRMKCRHFMKLSVKANKMQHHYREQNPI